MTSRNHNLFLFRARKYGACVRLALLLTFAFVALVAGEPFARAAATLEMIPGSDLPQSMQTGQTVSLRLRYTDSNGDEVSKSTAVLTDDGSDGRKTYTATDIDGTDTSKGVTITWLVNGFAAGGHQAYFQVTPVHPTGHIARYPAEASTYFSFGVEAPWLRWAELAGGIVVGLIILPFTTYLLFRSLNPRSDPSRAARGALFVGILAVCALFVYLFAGILSLPLLIGIAVVTAIIGIIVVFGRR